jgi:hypothetical protein
MLNVKKISIIKAVLFGLVLSNAGIAAGGAAAGEPVPVSAFLSSIPPMALQFADDAEARTAVKNLEKSTSPAFHGAVLLAIKDRIAHLAYGDLEQSYDRRTEEMFAFITGEGLTYPDGRDLNILKTHHAIIDSVHDARQAPQAIEERWGDKLDHDFPGMTGAEKNLWILLGSLAHGGPHDAAQGWLHIAGTYRNAIAAYRAHVAAAGHVDEDMG